MQLGSLTTNMKIRRFAWVMTPYKLRLFRKVFPRTAEKKADTYCMRWPGIGLTLEGAMAKLMSGATSRTSIIMGEPTVVGIALSNSALDKQLRASRAALYPKEVVGVIAGLIAAVSLFHVLNLFYIFLTRPAKRGAVSMQRIPLAVADVTRSIGFRWTISFGLSYSLNLVEVALTAAYISLLFVFALVNTTSTTGIKFEPHYFGNRAGDIAASQIPIIVALGTRNNIISWITGISYIKLSYLHRMTARVLCVMVWLHALGKMKTGAPATLPLVRVGLFALSSLALLCIVSIRPVRERAYQFFFVVHCVLVLMFLVATYVHLKDIHMAYYGILPAMILWGLDRFMHFARIIIFNFGYFKPTPSTSEDYDASVDVLSPQFLRITLRRPSHFRWAAGQCSYLSFPGVSSWPFEAHPFTISTTYGPDPSPSGNKLIFYARVHDGFTRKLRDRATEGEKFRVFLDGPYDSPPALVGYSTSILIAGGSGIAFILPLLIDLIGQARRGETTCRRVVFVWSIRESENIHWIKDSLSQCLHGFVPGLSVDVQIYITGKYAEGLFPVDSIAEKIEFSGSYSYGFSVPGVSVGIGRPDLQTLLGEEVQEASGPVSVNVCGGRSLAEAVMKAVRYPRPMDILRGGHTVSLFVDGSF